MNKEAIIAIIIGIGLGLGGALYFSNAQSPKQKAPQFEADFENTTVIPKTTSKAGKFAEYKALPATNSLLNSDSFTLKGKAQDNSHLFVVNQLGIEPVSIEKGQFKKQVALKPGRNDLVLFELNNKKEQIKALRLYSFQIRKSTAPNNDDEEATKEAGILKEKLEDKVIELRNSPKSVVSGEIKTVNEKNFTLVSGTEVTKVTVEPEITDFYQVNQNKLERGSFEDLKKGNSVTAFISDIGGEQISYTVYQEPNLAVAAGKISNLDEDQYQATIVNFDKTSFGADVQTSTTQNLYNQNNRQTTKGGFSKLTIGQYILAILSGSKQDYSIEEYLVL